MPPTTKPPPSLNIPTSASRVNVRIIDTTSRIKGIPFSLFLIPEYKGLDDPNCPAFSFPFEHLSTGRKFLFDLKASKDWRNGLQKIAKRIKDGEWNVKDVADILPTGGVDLKDIKAII